MAKMDRKIRRASARGRIRKTVRGDAQRPRLAVHRTLNHIYCQAIDDESGTTLAHASTAEKELRASMGSGGKMAAAKAVGEKIAARLKERGLESVVFDRGGFVYHGRIQALAEAAREGGLKF